MIKSVLLKEKDAGESLSRHPMYPIWQAMLARCYKPHRPDYPRYGGRGIHVCDRWKNDFSAFIEDMGPRPSNFTLDRIDNNKGYHPDNCKWSDSKTQSRNRRTSRRISAFGQIKTLAEWAEEYGVQRATIGFRLASGWDVERAISFPPALSKKTETKQ